MKIQVTQEDIDKGIRYHSKLCPISLACLRHVGLTYFEIWETYLSENHIESVTDFITNFDRQKEVHPFEFELPDWLKSKAPEVPRNE